MSFCGKQRQRRRHQLTKKETPGDTEKNTWIQRKRHLETKKKKSGDEKETHEARKETPEDKETPGGRKLDIGCLSCKQRHVMTETISAVLCLQY